MADFRQWRSAYRGALYDFGTRSIDFVVEFVVELIGAPDQIEEFEKPDLNEGLSDKKLSVLLYEKAIAQSWGSFRKIEGFHT